MINSGLGNPQPHYYICIMQPQTVYKTPNEIITYNIDLSTFTSEPATNVLNTFIYDFESELTTTDLIIDNVVIGGSGNQVLVTISGGLDKHLYLVLLQLRLSNGNIIEPQFFIVVDTDM